MVIKSDKKKEDWFLCGRCEAIYFKSFKSNFPWQNAKILYVAIKLLKQA